MKSNDTSWWHTQKPWAEISAGQLGPLPLREIELQVLCHQGVCDGEWFRESLGVPRGLWCQKIRLHAHHIAGKPLQDFHFMNALNYWQWNIQGQLVLLTIQVGEVSLTCHCLCPELFESIKGRLVSMQSRLRAEALPDCWLVQTISKAAVISGYNIFKKHFVVKGSLKLCFKKSPLLHGSGLLWWVENLSSHFSSSCGFQNFEVCSVWGFWLAGLFNQRSKHLSEKLI